MSKKIKKMPRSEDEAMVDSNGALGVSAEVSSVDTEASVAKRIITSCTEMMSSKGQIARIGLLKHASSETGVRRKKFLAAISKLADSEPAVTIVYGKAKVSVNRHGEALLEPGTLNLASFPAGVASSARSELPGSAPGNKVVDGILVPCGVAALVAGGGKGKTPLSHCLASAGVDNFSVVRVGEPLAGYSSSHESVAYSMAVAILDSSDIVVDSVKDLLAGGGGLMKSGLSREAIASLSSWASACCDAGCTMYVPVNPSVPDPEVIELLIEAGQSNTTMLITHVANSKWKYFNRTGEGLQRSSGSFSMHFGKNGLPAIKDGRYDSDSRVENSEIVRTVSASLSRDAVSNAARRALSMSTQ